MSIKIPYIHVVKKGENLYQISRKYKVDVKKLQALNNLDDNSIIHEGDRILLPNNANLDAEYEYSETVPSGNNSAESGIWPHPGTRTFIDGRLGGVEISANKGDEFVSISSGLVLFSAPQRGYGYTIMIISGDGYIYRYSGADMAYVRKGQIIEAGTKLGKIGINSHDGNAKLIFSVHLDGDPIDPSKAPRG